MKKILLITLGLFLAGFVIHSAIAADDTIPPSTVVNLSATSVSPASVSLSWVAPGDDNASGTVAFYDLRYRMNEMTESNFATSTPVGTEPVPHIAGTLETMTVSALSANTKYWFALRSVDDAGNTSALSNTISTTTSDTIAPLISAISVSGITPTSAQINWTTNEASNSLVRSGTTSGYASTATASALVTSHVIPLASLAPATLYHFSVSSADALGNTATSSDQTFTTLAPSTPTSTIAATVKVEPKAITPKNTEKKIRMSVRLPNGATFSGLNQDSIRLNGTVKPIKITIANLELKKIKNKIQFLGSKRTLSLEFTVGDILPLVPDGAKTLAITITGSIAAGNFSGADTVRLVPPLDRTKVRTDIEARIREHEKRIDELKKEWEERIRELEKRFREREREIRKEIDELRKRLASS